MEDFKMDNSIHGAGDFREPLITLGSTQNLTVPSRNAVNRTTSNFFSPMGYPQSLMGGFAGMGNSYSPYYSGFNTNSFEGQIMNSLSPIQNLVQTVNAVSTLVNATYSALYTSVSTIGSISEQVKRSKSQFMQILASINILSWLKRIWSFLKSMLTGNGPSLEQALRTLYEWRSKVSLSTLLPSESLLGYLFCTTMVAGPIIIYKYVRMLSQISETEGKWNSESGKSYAARIQADFVARNADELTVVKGDIITIAPPAHQKEVNWYLVSDLKNRQGLVPSSFVTVLGLLEKNKPREEQHN